MKTPLTARQAEVFHFVENYLEEQSRAPTLQEICDHFGFRSLSSAQDHLRLIEKKGYLTTQPNSSRSIRIVRDESDVDSSGVVSVPLVGRIAAGTPTFALEEITEVLPLPKALFRMRNLFALRVKGDSMLDAGIHDGDVAVLKSQPTFDNGEIAAVVIDEEATLKRLFLTKRGLRLHAENEAYPDRVIPRSQMDRSCRVAGVLVGTIRQF